MNQCADHPPPHFDPCDRPGVITCYRESTGGIVHYCIICFGRRVREYNRNDATTVDEPQEIAYARMLKEAKHE